MVEQFVICRTYARGAVLRGYTRGSPKKDQKRERFPPAPGGEARAVGINTESREVRTVPNVSVTHVWSPNNGETTTITVYGHDVQRQGLLSYSALCSTQI